MDNSNTIFAARVSDVDGTLVRNGADVISLFAEVISIEGDNVESPSVPLSQLSEHEFGVHFPGSIVPQGSQVVKLDCTVLSEVISGNNS